MLEVKIDERLVGDAHPCFIIAEAGSNHNGSLSQAKALIDIAADAGADAVKFQVYRAHRLYVRDAGVSDYLKVPRPIYDIIQEMELPYEWIPELAQYSRQKGIYFMASPFDEGSADQIDPYVEVHKIASYEMTHLPLIRHIAQMGKPTFMSTGTGNADEVAEAVAAFRETGNGQIILNQCTAAYPAPPDSLNLRAITTLRDRFGVLVGLSDHSQDPLVGPLAAVSLGACSVEKHFTFSKSLPGPDHPFALEPSELRLMVNKIREVEMALGTGEKVPQQAEQELRQFARRSIFSIAEIAEGEELTPQNIAVLRHGKRGAGLEPKVFPALLGRPAARAIPAQTLLTDGDVR